MKHLLISKPIVGMLVLLLLVQMACVASSISPTPTPGGAGGASSQSTQGAGTQPSTGAQTSQAPIGNAAQNTQTAPSTGGGQSTQSVPATGGQATQTQSVPSTGAQATQAMPTTSSGAQATTPANAQALLNQVAQHYQSAGRQQALKDFTEQNPPFNAPDMFIMCIGSDHKITAMGGFPLLVGVSADSLNELTGQSIGSLIWDAATLQTQGSVKFQWKNPLSNAAESKVIYYQKLSQDVCGVVANQP